MKKPLDDKYKEAIRKPTPQMGSITKKTIRQNTGSQFSYGETRINLGIIATDKQILKTRQKIKKKRFP